MTPVAERGARRANWTFISLAIATAVIAVVTLANAHLVYVAVSSQPDCVPHVKDKGGEGSFRAAKPAC